MDQLFCHIFLCSEEYYISVPKFSIKTNVNLNGVLRQMGMTDMFGAAANFSGIAENVALSVSEVRTVTVDKCLTVLLCHNKGCK